METNILIVDDEAAIADLVEVYLKNEGYTVHKFGRAGDALACVASTPLDLAILDVDVYKRQVQTAQALRPWTTDEFGQHHGRRESDQACRYAEDGIGDEIHRDPGVVLIQGECHRGDRVGDRGGSSGQGGKKQDAQHDDLKETVALLVLDVYKRQGPDCGGHLRLPRPAAGEIGAPPILSHRHFRPCAALRGTKAN